MVEPALPPAPSLLCSMCLLEGQRSPEEARVEGTSLCAEHVTALDPQSRFMREARAARRSDTRGSS